LDLRVLPLEGPEDAPRKPFPFLRTEFNEFAGQFSPDMRWIAYTSNESGTNEVYVRPLSPDAGGGSPASGGKWMVSKGGGEYAHWRSDGKQLFYRRNGAVIAVDVKFQAGAPARLFDSGFLAGGGATLSADGKRFIFPLPESATAALATFTVLLSWQAGLRK
jgi:Tol biopolymer transport system component